MMEKRFIVLLAFVLVVITLLGCAKEIEAQEGEVFSVPAPPNKIETKVEWVTAIEQYEVKTTRWEPVTTIEKKEREVKRPVFVIVETQQPSKLELDFNVKSLVSQLEPTLAVENSVLESGSVTSGVDVISVPRVAKEGPFRNVQRNDNFITVDGFQGTTGVIQATRPIDGFGGVQVGLSNTYSQGDLEYTQPSQSGGRLGGILRRILGR
jgi:hypothetical protein